MPKICYVPKNFGLAALEKIDLVNEIIEEYAAQGFDLTLRGIYYQMVSRDHIPNNIREYKNLGVLISDARLAGLVDWDRVVDRVRSLEQRSSWVSPAAIIRTASRSYHTDLWQKQEYRLEVWVEKNAVTGIVEPVCRRLDVPFFACIGYTSQTAIWEAAQRLRGYIREGKTPIIIHLGDHDPSGIDMTRDIRERLDLFLTKDCEEAYPSLEYYGIEVNRIALNRDQISRYNPPPNPAKLTDSRATAYIREFGDSSWELDALSPNVVADLIEGEVSYYRDEKKWEEAVKEESKGVEFLEKTVKYWRKVTEFLEGQPK